MDANFKTYDDDKPVFYHQRTQSKSKNARIMQKSYLILFCKGRRVDYTWNSFKTRRWVGTVGKSDVMAKTAQKSNQFLYCQRYVTHVRHVNGPVCY